MILAESILDAQSFHQVGISIAIPIYGVNGFTHDHLDLLKREGVKRVVLALDSDDAGRKGTGRLKGKLEAVGIAVRVASFPEGVKDANELLVSRNGDAGEVFRQLLDAAISTTPQGPPAPEPISTPPFRDEKAASVVQLVREGVTYHARAHSLRCQAVPVALHTAGPRVTPPETHRLPQGRMIREYVTELLDWSTHQTSC